jgi:hypothetical protein
MITFKGQQLAAGLIPCLVSLIVGCAAQVQHSPASAKSATQKVSTLASPAASADAIVIEPGRRVGALQLGDTRERVIEIFPKKPNYDEEYNYDGMCPRTEIHWLDIDLTHENEPVSNGVFVYLKEGHVFQIEAATPRFHTADGITENSTPEEVRRHHQQLKSYVLSNSGAKVNGGRDLVYWIDRQNGIAFEFYYDSAGRKRRVSKVIVFQPGTDMQPEGCISAPQELHQLEPFALEPPTGTQKQ